MFDTHFAMVDACVCACVCAPPFPHTHSHPSTSVCVQGIEKDERENPTSLHGGLSLDNMHS